MNDSSYRLGDIFFERLVNIQKLNNRYLKNRLEMIFDSPGCNKTF